MSTDPSFAGYEPEQVTYHLIPQTPPLPPRELEVDGSAIEVVVVWGGLSVLHVAHLAPPRAFWLGDSGPDIDFVLGHAMLGSARLPLVLDANGETAVVVPRGATAEIERGAERLTLDALAHDTELRELAEYGGARSFPLTPGIAVRIQHGELTFIVRSVAPAARVGTRAASEPVWQRSRWQALSAAVHLLLLGWFYFMPPRSAALSMDRLDEGSRLVNYLIEARENRLEEVPRWLSDGGEAGGGERAANDEGEAGMPHKPATARKLAVAGAREPRLEVPRDVAAREARQAGIIGILTGAASDTATSLYDAERAIGSDPITAIGAIFGETSGESGGWGGLGMHGTGRGGGGDAAGTLGLGGLGTRGRAGRDGDGDGYGGGDSAGSFRQRTERIPRVRTGQPDLHGSLSKEVIRRTIGRHINEVRFCYESQLISRPDLQGRVAIQFVIGPTGAVMRAKVAQSDVGSAQVDSCIEAAVSRMSFPQPEGGGLVIVTYPFMLSQS